jgi:hypothetical protein
MSRNDPRLAVGCEGWAGPSTSKWRGAGKRFCSVEFDCGVTLDVQVDDLHQLRGQTFRLHVTPLDGFTIEVDPYSIIEDYHYGGQRPASRSEIGELVKWIEEGKVSIEAVSLRHAIPPGYEAIVQEVEKVASGKSEEHKYLCGLGAAYVASLGKPYHKRGHRESHHVGGFADGGALDGSLFIECGTINPLKVPRMMEHHQTLMLIPYGTHVETPETKDVLREVGYIFRPVGMPPYEPRDIGSEMFAAYDDEEGESVEDEKTIVEVPVIAAPDGQPLVDRRAAKEMRRRVVHAPDFTRDGAPCSVAWLVKQSLALYLKGRSTGAIVAAFNSIGVRHGSGKLVEEGDVKRWLAL